MGNVVQSFSSTDSTDATGAFCGINLWLDMGMPPSNGQEVEVTIADFEFIPQVT